MSRAPGGMAMSDIRSAAILEDYLYTTDPCAPGADSRRARTHVAQCGVPPCGFDKPRYLVSIFASMLIVAIIIGLLHCFSLYIPVIQKEYDMGFVEVAFTAGITYAIIIKSSCLACFLIEWVGHRLTAVFGMLLVFIGLILDAHALHFAVFYVVNIIFFGIGGGLAYACAISISGDLFRKNLMMGMIFVSVAGCLGTILLYWFTIFLMSHVSYKWARLCIAIIVLLFTGAAHAFPSYPVDDDCGGVHISPDKSQMDREIKDCVDQASKRDRSRHPPTHENEKACLCVCVCDISLWSDWSFLLWGICVFIGTMALYLPYMYIIMYADAIGLLISPWYITILCLTSAVGRIAILAGNDYTFNYNRIIYVGVVIASGVLWIVLPSVETYGWLIVWCGLMGVIEGIIVAVIPRVTLLTIPRKWMQHSWGWILWFNAVGIFVITVFVAVVARELMDFYVAFVAVGILQIIGGFLAILLPNEEGGGGGASSSNPCGDTNPPRSGYASGAFSKTFNSTRTTTAVDKNNLNYKCACPICFQTGCIPECPGCIPGGLSSGGMQPCA